LLAAQTVPLAEHDLGHQRSPEKIAAEDERVEQIVRAMDALPQRQGQVLYLFSIERLSQQEIAEVLGISAEATKASLSLARRALRQRLESME
jgi:RNA polymerase sigma factor (sigma-70 family)